MKIAVVFVAVLAFASACKKKDAAPASTGSGSAVAVAPADAAVAPQPPPAPAVLEYDTVSDEDSFTGPEFGTTFGKTKVPRLPAISADGSTLAIFKYPAGMPSFPLPVDVLFVKFPSGETVKSLPIVTDEESATEAEPDKWVTPAIEKKLQARGAAIMKALEGFHSLVPVPLEQDKESQKIGDLTLTTSGGKRNDGTLGLELRDSKGKLLHSAHIDSYSEGNRGEAFENSPCNYDPTLNGAYRDPAKPAALYLDIGYYWQEDCDQPKPTYVAWSTDPNSTTPAELIEDLVGKQFELISEKGDQLLPELFAPDAVAVGLNMIETPGKFDGASLPQPTGSYDGHVNDNLVVTMARDGKSAWASVESAVHMLGGRGGIDPNEEWRASNLLVPTAKGWRIVALAWTQPTENKQANDAAKKGEIKAGKLSGDGGDQSLRDAFAKLTTDGATNVANDLVAFGSGPGERTTTGAAFTKPWNAAWKGKTTIVSSVARLAPSGTTGWVAATVELQKKGYKIPFTVFAVFDKDASGAWTLVHIHFGV